MPNSAIRKPLQVIFAIKSWTGLTNRLIFYFSSNQDVYLSDENEFVSTTRMSEQSQIQF